MTVDGADVADRLRPLVGGLPGAEGLVGQLGSGMDDSDYLPIAIAIARLIATTEAR